MEGRKAIVKKLFYEAGIKEGRHMFKEIEVLKKRWVAKRHNYDLRHDDRVQEVVKVVEKGRLKLFNLLFKEVELYAPKRIRNYLDKAAIQTIEAATDKFNIYLKELASIYFEEADCSYKEPIHPREAEDLLKTYNKLLDDSIEKMVSGYPKGIYTYLDRLDSKRDSVLDTFEAETVKKPVEIYKDKRMIDLRDSANLSIKMLHKAFHKSRIKAFLKLSTAVKADKYSLFKPMGEEKFSRFILKCGYEDFFDGVFTEYNIEAVSDIYPFPNDTIPLINYNKDITQDVKEAENVITEHYKNDVAESHKEDYFNDLFDK